MTGGDGRILDPDIAHMGTEKMRSVVEVELRDGRTIRRVADTARGTPEKPLKGIELDGKFRECASFVFDGKAINQILSAVRTIETLPSIGQLTSLLKVM